MKTLGIVPARQGSKGIRFKNKRSFMGKPLVAWSIEVAKATCTRVVVTSDDPDILRIADDYGVETLVRPDDLAQDETPMLDVLRHVLACQTRGSDVVVLLQPTTPMRTPEDVKRALVLLNSRTGLDSVASVVRIPAHMSPDYACKVESGLLGWFLPANVVRRQDCRAAYYRDGTVYAIREELLRSGKLYGRCLPMILDSTCTIDTEADWKHAERMWRQRGLVQAV